MTDLDALVERLLAYGPECPTFLDMREAASALEAMGAELAAAKVGNEKLLGKLWAEREKATKDIDSLQSELALRPISHNDWYELCNSRDALRLQVEALRKDAGRYRWLRSAYVSKIDVPSLRLGLNDADQFDAAIDAALSAGQDKV